MKKYLVFKELHLPPIIIVTGFIINVFNTLFSKEIVLNGYFTRYNSWNNSRLTEFLPVSSSGHLEIAKVLLDDESIGKHSMLMTVVLHGATALSTIYIFWKDIKDIF